MHKASRFLAALTVVALGALGFGTSHAANATGCVSTNTFKVKYTAAGSCKTPKGNSLDIRCGTNGQVTNAIFGIDANAVGTDGVEVEACSDSGNGDTQGRLMLVASASHQGVRAILDSDDEQAFPAGWDLVEVATGAQGLFCSAKNTIGDGYQQSWSLTGPATGPTCVQNLAPGSRAMYGHMFDAAAGVLVKQMPQFASQIAQLRVMLAL